MVPGASGATHLDQAMNVDSAFLDEDMQSFCGSEAIPNEH
jgi:hypothetical protein